MIDLRSIISASLNIAPEDKVVYLAIITRTTVFLQLKEEAMKAGLAEKYALEKNLLALKQKLQAESVAEKNYLATQEQ